MIYALLTRRNVDFVGFTDVAERQVSDVVAPILDLMDVVEDGFVVPVEVPSDLCSRHRSRLLQHVEQLLDGEFVVFKQRPSKVVEVRLAGVTVVLLGVLPSDSFLDDLVAFAVDAGYHRAKSDATEPLIAILAVREEY